MKQFDEYLEGLVKEAAEKNTEQAALEHLSIDDLKKLAGFSTKTAAQTKEAKLSKGLRALVRKGKGRGGDYAWYKELKQDLGKSKAKMIAQEKSELAPGLAKSRRNVHEFQAKRQGAHLKDEASKALKDVKVKEARPMMRPGPRISDLKRLVQGQFLPLAVPGVVGGGAIGAGVGALSADEGERLKGALIGGGLGAGAGGLSSMLGGVGGANLLGKPHSGVPAIGGLLAGMGAGTIGGGLAGGAVSTRFTKKEEEKEEKKEASADIGDLVGRLLAKVAGTPVNLDKEELMESIMEARDREDIAGRSKRWGFGGGVGGGALGGAAGGALGYGAGRLLAGAGSSPGIKALSRFGGAAMGAIGGGIGGSMLGSDIGSRHGAEEAAADAMVAQLRQRVAGQRGAMAGYMAGMRRGGNPPFPQGR